MSDKDKHFSIFGFISYKEKKGFKNVPRVSMSLITLSIICLFSSQYLTWKLIGYFQPANQPKPKGLVTSEDAL